LHGKSTISFSSILNPDPEKLKENELNLEIPSLEGIAGCKG
jgi:hypothetical protein